MSLKKRGIDRRRSTVSPEFPLTLASGERVTTDRRQGGGRRRLDPIARQAIFSEVAFSTLESLAEYWGIRSLQTGQVLLSPGEVNHHLYLLLDGSLNVHLDRQDGETGFLIEPGECTGEISIIDGRPATAYVVAAEPSQILAVQDSRFWGEFMRHPQIARNFMRLFAERFRARNLTMQKALEERLRYEHLERELGIAQEIQAGMLPRALDLCPALDLAAKMVPARHVGGDFYDLFMVGDEEVCVVIGDVAGKGVPAALFMARTMTQLRSEMLHARSLETAVGNLNAALCQDNDRCMFVTLIVGVVNWRSGQFRYVVGGHNPAVLGERGAAYGFLPQPEGILVGVDPQADYRAASASLRVGDVLVLYTDGITEAMNPAHELFTDGRLLECLNTAEAGSSAQVVEAIESAVRAFVTGAPPSDDLTLVVMRYRGCEAD